MDIEVTRDVIAALVAHAEQDPKLECCGLLLGSAPASWPVDALAEPAPGRITLVRPTANVHPEPARHFEIDPAALIGAYRAERSGGPALIGFYHSHPNGHPQPSAHDCEHAGGDGRVWGIIAAGAVHFWRDAPQGFIALPVAVVTA